ncbi:MAG: SprB repeat-containing protein [Bacteroidales bacterium]
MRLKNTVSLFDVLSLKILTGKSSPESAMACKQYELNRRKNPVYKALMVFTTILFLLSAAVVNGQTTFTATLSGNWTTVSWAKTGPSLATYPGQPGFEAETHDVVINGGAITVTLNASITSSVRNVTLTAGTLNIGTNNLTMTGDLSGAGALSMSTGSLNIAGNNTSTGTFNPGLGTVRYNGAAQTVRGTTYYNLVIAGSNVKTCAANTVVSNTLNIQAGQLNASTRDVSVGGMTTIATGGSYTPSLPPGLNTFGDVTLSGGSIASTLGAAPNVTITGNLLVNNSVSSSITRINLDISGTTSVQSGATLTLDGANGAVVFGSLVTVDGSWNNTADNDCNFRNGLTFNGPSFVSGTGTYTFETSSQAISGTQPITFSGGVYVSTTGITVTNNTIVTIIGVLRAVNNTIWRNAANSVLNYENASMPMGTNATRQLDATAVPNLVNYAGSVNQSVKPTPYYNLTASGSGTKTLGGATTVNNNLTITGSATLLTNQYTLTGNATGLMTAAAGTSLLIGSATSATNVPFPTNFTSAHITLDPASTVSYIANTSQTVSATPVYGNLSTATSGTKSFANNITVAGNLTIGLNTTLDATASNYNLTLAGNWTNNGNFNERQGRVTFNGSGAQTIQNTLAGSESFYNLTTNTTGSVNAAINLAVVNNLTMTAGNILLPSNTLTLGTSAASTGSLTYTAGWINGTFARWTSSLHNNTDLLFPVGTALNARNMTLNFATIATGGLLTANFVGTPPTTGGLPLTESGYAFNQLFSEGYWNLQKDATFTMTGNFDIDLLPEGFTSFPIDGETRVLSRFTASNWFLNGTHVPGSSAMLYRAGLNSFTNNYAIGYAEACDPHLVNCPADVVIANTAGLCSGIATWTAPTMDATCAGFTITSNHNSGEAFNVGTTQVVYYLMFGAVRRDSCKFNVIVHDTELPVVQCRNINLYVDASGNATLTGAMIDNGSTDNCSVALLPGRTTFNCSDVGSTVPVLLTGTDPSGNFSTCTAQVSVLDTIRPVINTRSFTLVLTAAGTGTLLPTDVDNGTADNCSPVTLSVLPNTFDCGDTGLQTVTFTATDASGNSRSTNIQITVQSSVTINGASLSNCDLAGPFALYTADVVGGDGNYTYFWDGLNDAVNPFVAISGTFPFLVFSNTSTSETPFFNNLLADGTYTIRLTVTDGNGCSASFDMLIVKSGFVFNNITVRYSGACEGSTVTYSVANDPAATYNWGVENGTILTSPLNTNSIDVRWNTGVTQGVVISTASKTNILGQPCESTVIDTVAISAPPVPVFNGLQTSVCANSVVTYTLTNVYTSYTWAVTGGTITGGGTGNSFVTVRWGTGAAGTIDVTVQGATSCPGTAHADIAIYNLQGSLVSQTNVTCNGANNGSVTVAATVGTGLAPYEYSIDGGPYQASGTFNGIAPGIHAVTIRDALLCTFDVSFTITQPTVLTGIITKTDIACFGTNSGTITATGSGGTSPYQYSVDGGAYQASGSFTGLAAGMHTVSVRDANACVYNQTINITQPASPLSGSITAQTNILCFGGSTGSVTVAGAGGTSPYQYRLDAGTYQASGTFGSLTAGSYTVTVRDANLCTVTVPVVITGPAAALSGSVTSQTNVDCNGNATGSFTIAGSGGTAPYQYSNNGGAYQASGTFSGLTDGTYNVVIRDANLCTYNLSVIITEPVVLNATVSAQTNVACFGDATGQFTIAASGGTSPYQYSNNGSPYQASPTFTGLTAGTYVVTVQDAHLCTFVVNVIITQPPLLVATATSNSPVCEGTALNLTGGPAGMASYSWTGPNGFTSTLQSPSIAAATPVMSGVYTLVVVNASGCTANANTNVTVTPLNTISLTSGATTNNQTVCINTAITNITYATTGATGATVTGLPTGVTGTWAANVVTISGTPSVAGTSNYTVTLTGGCGTVTATGSIVVNPNNTITLTSGATTNNQTVCINTPITNITYSTTGATGASFSGLPAGVTGSWAANVVTITGTPTVAGTANYTVTLTGGCGNITANGTIVVNPNNTITLTSAPGSNNQTVCINTPVTTITYATTGATGANFTGLPTGMVVSYVANTVTIAGTPTTAGPFNYTVTLTGGCGTVSASGTINVNALNAISLTSAAGTDNQNACVNSPITNITYSTTGATGATVSGLPAGVTGSWAGNVVTISGTPTVAGNANYTITLTGGCGNITATGVIHVNADNTITLTSGATTNNQTVCINTPVTNITYSTTGATGATFSGLPAGVTGSWAANVVTISGSPTVAGTANYTVTLTGGCGIVTATGTIVVNPNNTVTLTSGATTNNQTVCVNTPVTNITYSTTGATGATFSGLPAGVTGSWAANVVTISGTPSVSGTANYTVTLTGGCGNVTATGTILVNPNNTITLTSGATTNNQTVCINTPITNITYSTTGATGATFTGLPAGVTGSWAANVVTISGTPTVAVTANYTVTLTGGCGNISASGTIIVNPDNTITLTSGAATNNQTVCINTPITNITYSTTGATGATFSGLPAGVTGTWAGNVVTISGSPSAAVTANYTVTLTGGCGNTTATGTITVNPNNTITLTSGATTNNQTVCINTPITNITYSTTGATGATFSGLPAGVTGSWAGNVVTITGIPTVAVTANYTVTLTGGCGNVTATGTILVNPNNTVTLTSGPTTNNQTVCINTPITNITYSTTGATGATFSGLPAGVTGSWAANVVTISGTPSVSVTANYTVTLTGGCGNITATGTILVNPDNTITLTSGAATNNQTVCINTAITNITYSTSGATGATFSGLPAGVTGAWAGNVVTITGTPTVSGTANYTVTLTGGCGNVTATGSILVNPDNTITLTSGATTNNQTVCINTPVANITYSTTGATGATFTGLPAGVTGSWAANVVTISGSPSVAGTANYTVTLTGGCGNVTATGTIAVNPDNTITLTSGATTNNQTVCINTPITNITYSTTGATGATFSGLPAGVTGSWAGNVVTITGTPSVATTANYTVTLTGGCGNVTATGTIIVNPDNTITLTSPAGTDNQTICIGSSILNITYATTGATGAIFAGLPAGMTFSWASNTALISGTPTQTGVYNYSITLTGGCGVVIANGTLTVNDNNSIILTSGAGTNNQNACLNSAITDITYSTIGATGATFAGLPAGVTGTWVANVVTITGSPTGPAGTYNYTVNLTGGCGTASATGSIIVSPDNTITLTSVAGSNTQTVCINSAISNITYSTTGATGAIVSGLPAGVTGTWAANVVTISGAPTGAGSFSYLVTLTGGCGIVTESGTITVTPDNTVTLSSALGTDNQSVCVNSPIIDITYTTTGATGATVAGLPLGVTGSWASDIFTITGTPTVSGAFMYTVTLTGGCGIITTTGVITINDKPTATQVVTDVLCHGASTGAIDVTVSGGTAPYTFLWSNGATSEDLSGVTAGTYTVVVTDANGCTATAGGTISEPAAALAPVLVVTNAACANPAGSVDLTVSGGTPGYTFAWTGPSGFSATTEDIGSLLPGTYNVTITDLNGCTKDTLANIVPNPDLVDTLVVTDVSCGSGGADGAIDMTVAGGLAPYTFSWSNGAVTEDLSALIPGKYIVTITDANGCSIKDSVIVHGSGSNIVITGAVTNVTCFGAGNGSIDISVNGGATPYSFLWSNGSVTEDISGLAPGTYSVTVTDLNTCTNTASFDVTEPSAALAGTTTATNIQCFGDLTGSVNLTVTGGTSPYTFAWSNGATTEDLAGVAAGVYTVTVTDANGCTTTASGTVTGPAEALSGSTAVIMVLCHGASSGEIDLTVSGGTAPYTYSWNNGAVTEDINGLAAGSYSVKVTDANGCFINVSSDITEPETLAIEEAHTDATCPGILDG